MNYIILNDKEYFEDKIEIKNFKRVTDENERCDAVFAKINRAILEDIYKNRGRREELLPESWLLRDGGVSFILCKIDTSILHDKDETLVEKLLGLYDKESFFIEIRSYNNPQSYNQIETYVFCYNKNFGYQENIMPDKIDGDEPIITLLCQHLEKKIL